MIKGSLYTISIQNLYSTLPNYGRLYLMSLEEANECLFNPGTFYPLSVKSNKHFKKIENANFVAMLLNYTKGYNVKFLCKWLYKDKIYFSSVSEGSFTHFYKLVT